MHVNYICRIKHSKAYFAIWDTLRRSLYSEEEEEYESTQTITIVTAPRKKTKKGSLDANLSKGKAKVRERS